MSGPLDRGCVVAVVGATGAVGAVLLEVLAERSFPVAELRPLASERSAGTAVTFRGETLRVELAAPDWFDGADLVFFAATGALSKELGPEVARRGGIAIDKSSTWRLHQRVPLVVPEVNADRVEDHDGILACPNCTTIPLVMVLEPLRRRAGLKSVVVTTFQSVSGAGLPGLEELAAQQSAQLAGEPLPPPHAFPAQIADNVIPVCEALLPDGYSSEEHKLLDESRKILELPELQVSMTCVRVPVPVGHSGAVLVETERPLAVQEAIEALRAFPGIVVYPDGPHPTPADVAGRDDVLVGRIRRDLHSDRLWLWEVGDNLRKGAATNAVQIAEELLRRELVGSSREPAKMARRF
ncbi:MAG TPA: aspartate-semialdehyde dehydrogenase [Thermoanaerobaculia bacterium]|nr:aspartate-semialdehyde dehydrogenase [Thermoanaerobaculia bacterium]